MERLIRKGAEADIYLGEWFGIKAILKIRKPKQYRQPDLDSEIRKRRTLREASYLVDARKSGVSTPLVYFVDQNKAEIVMQFIKGTRFKEIIAYSKPDDVYTLCSDVGTNIAKLHKNNIIHGDLTTSNFLVMENNVIVLIDFGLAFSSQRLEDKAVDLHLMKETLTSAHSKVADDAFKKILEGYSKFVGIDMIKDLIKKVREIERRGRYTRVE